ncbi:MAG: hypothetical protein GDYSWBUE_001025 [Candidatus Fervidibacterota bacterium]
MSEFKSAGVALVVRTKAPRLPSANSNARQSLSGSTSRTADQKIAMRNSAAAYVADKLQVKSIAGDVSANYAMPRKTTAHFWHICNMSSNTFTMSTLP